MEICVVGTGYVGLVAGACFAETGNDVTCVDVDESKIEKLKKGIIPIYEPGLEEIVKRSAEEERLRFTTDLAEGVKPAKAVIIAVGTPEDKDGRADLRYVLSVAEDIGRILNHADTTNFPKIIIDKSTVPVGTADKVRDTISALTDKPFHVVSNPEFMKEGAAIQDFLKPDRVVIGADNEEIAEHMKELYAPFVRTQNPIIVMDVRSAEMTKYAANAMLATKISFMNEVAGLCDAVGADIDMVRKGIGHDQRIGFQFLFPGVGYGGSCFPKDVKALARVGDEYKTPMEIIHAVDAVNTRQKNVLVYKVKEALGDDLHGKTIAVWGLAFKPRTDDMRDAPAITTIVGLIEAGARIRATDPQAIETAKAVFATQIQKGDLTLHERNYKTLEGCDALVVVTEWNEFRHPNFEKIKDRLNKPIIIDGRNLYDCDNMKEMGFTYLCVGRPRQN